MASVSARPLPNRFTSVSCFRKIRTRGRRFSTRNRELPSTFASAQKVEYVWVDTAKGSGFRGVRSRTRVLQEPVRLSGTFPEWEFDGSSTGDIDSGNSDLLLKPVFSCFDPIRGEGNAIVLCEVLNSDRTPHASNSRARLAAAISSKEVKEEAPLFGLKQAYTMLGKNRQIYGWPAGGFPPAEGSFYCGVGADGAYGRPLAEAHLDACVRAGLALSSISAGPVPGQWQFQMGPAGALELGDMVAVAWWLLHRIGEDFGISVAVEAPVPAAAGKQLSAKGRAAGCSMTFSTASMRRPGGISVVNATLDWLAHRHADTVKKYREAGILSADGARAGSLFTSGVGDRAASVRIPLLVAAKGMGHLEDRRLGAGADPYEAARLLLDAALGSGTPGASASTGGGAAA